MDQVEKSVFVDERQLDIDTYILRMMEMDGRLFLFSECGSLLEVDLIHQMGGTADLIDHSEVDFMLFGTPECVLDNNRIVFTRELHKDLELVIVKLE